MTIQVTVYAGNMQFDVAYCDTVQQVHVGHMDGRVGFSRTLEREMSGVVSTLGDNISDLEIGRNSVVRPLASRNVCPWISRDEQELTAPRGRDDPINHHFISLIRPRGESHLPIEVLTSNPQAIKSMR